MAGARIIQKSEIHIAKGTLVWSDKNQRVELLADVIVYASLVEGGSWYYLIGEGKKGTAYVVPYACATII